MEKEETEETKKKEEIDIEELSEELKSYLTLKEFVKQYVIGRQKLNEELTIDEIIDICFSRMISVLRYKAFEPKCSLYDECAKYLTQYYPLVDVNNDFQAAILITAWKSFIAGAKTRPSFTLKCDEDGETYEIKNVDWVNWDGSLSENGKIEVLEYDVDGIRSTMVRVSNFSISMN
jgi:hypothetical protein